MRTVWRGVAFLVLGAGVAGAQARHAEVQPTGPTVLLDTTGGRLSCRLFTAQSPAATARFLELAKVGKYDSSFLTGITDGLSGDQAQGAAPAESFAPDKTPVTLDRAGILAMPLSKGVVQGSRFAVLEHGDLEYKDRMEPIGLCDASSVAKVEAMSHDMLAVANRPPVATVLNKVIVLADGEAAPPLTPNGAPVALTYPPELGAEIPSPEPTGPMATIDTTQGTMHCRLFEQTPVATANFIALAEGTKPWRNAKTHAEMRGKPFYNGLHFRRVIPDFMVQQSDLPGDPAGDGSIGFQFPNEIVPGLRFDRSGRLAYANDGPTTNASEFFITETPQPRLTGNYTIFGQCDPASVDVAAKIARVPRDAHNVPLTPVTIRSITIR